MHTQFPGLAEHLLQAEDSLQFEAGLSRPSSRKARQSYTRRGFQATVSKRVPGFGPVSGPAESLIAYHRKKTIGFPVRTPRRWPLTPNHLLRMLFALEHSDRVNRLSSVVVGIGARSPVIEEVGGIERRIDGLEGDRSLVEVETI